MLGDLVVGAVDLVTDAVVDVFTGSDSDEEDEEHGDEARSEAPPVE